MRIWAGHSLSCAVKYIPSIYDLYQHRFSILRQFRLKRWRKAMSFLIWLFRLHATTTVLHRLLKESGIDKKSDYEWHFWSVSFFWRRKIIQLVREICILKKSINTTSDMHHKRQMTTITAYSGGYACARRRLSESKRLLSRNISNFGENLPYSPL